MEIKYYKKIKNNQKIKLTNWSRKKMKLNKKLNKLDHKI